MASLPIVDTEAEDGAVVDEPAQLSEVEELAAEMGWKPEKDFSGPSGKWKPAKDYILRGKEIQDGLRDTTKDLKRTMEQMASAGAKMTERAMREQAAEIEAKYAAAMDAKDGRAAAAAVREMDALTAEAKTIKTDNPEKDFGDRNPWYNTNRKAKALAIIVSQEEAQKGATVEQQLAAAEKAVREDFPELFETTAAPTRKAAEVAAPNGRSTTINRPKGPNDLPGDVKKAMEGYVEMFRSKMPADKFDADKIRANYAKDYYADQA